MAQCHLCYPGLLGPAVPLEELAPGEWPDQSGLAGLGLLFRRAQRRALVKQSVEHQVLTRLGYLVSPDVELPVARLRTQSDPESTAKRLWCLDPVYVQLDREMAYLTDPAQLALSENEAREIIASLNAHFGDIMHVRYHTTGQWLVNIDLDVHTTPPTQAMQEDINRVQASGKDGSRWRQILNEIQMLLHAHPVNETRMASAQPPVNSVWLWGGGELQIGPTMLDLVYTDNTLAQAAALRNAVACKPMPTNITTDLLAARNSLLILTRQIEAVRQKDVYAWLTALQHFDQHYVMPLLAMLRQGDLTSVTLWSDTLQLQLDKSRLGRWWQRLAHPAKAVLGLRDSYGY